jgi:hypothetical protein
MLISAIVVVLVFMFRLWWCWHLCSADPTPCTLHPNPHLHHMAGDSDIAKQRRGSPGFRAQLESNRFQCTGQCRDLEAMQVQIRVSRLGFRGLGFGYGCSA